jgi:signal transduction histidine kinase
MEALVVDLLTYARVGASAITMRRVDLADIVGEALAQEKSSVQVREAQVDVRALPSLDGDPILLRQLFANLIGNAVKFAKPGTTPVVTISGDDAGIDGLGRAMAEVRVTDDGIGFAPEYAERIFRIFERLSVETAGTGVGLAICKKIVELHGGTIQATSTPGEGATFTVRLPIEQLKEASDA